MEMWSETYDRIIKKFSFRSLDGKHLVQERVETTQTRYDIDSEVSDSFCTIYKETMYFFFLFPLL